MHHITSSVTYRDLKLLELNFMWGGDKSNDTSSHWTKNHLTLFWIRRFSRFLNAEKSVLWTRSRRILSAYTGVWGSPNKRFVAMDSHEHCLLILYKAKTKNFFKRFHRISFNHKLRQAGPSYIQSRNACWSHAPNPVNCDGTSQAVYCGI